MDAPRGCLADAVQLLESYKISVTIVDDDSTKGKPLKVGFKGKLRTQQKDAVKALRLHDIGVLSATTAFGKTVVAAKMIAVHKRSTLILVHRKQLSEQWRERLATFLSVSVDDIGQIEEERRSLMEGWTLLYCRVSIAMGRFIKAYQTMDILLLMNATTYLLLVLSKCLNRQALNTS